MEKIDLATILAPINETLPAALRLKQYIVSTNEVLKEFIFEVHVSVSSETHEELIHGMPANSILVNDEQGVDSEVAQYIKNSFRQCVAAEFEKYQQHKASVYTTSDVILKEQKFSCKHVCHDCHTTGKVICESCTGNGYVSCRRCHGSGKIYLHTSGTQQPKVQVCNYCNNGRAQCVTCFSTGKVDCHNCGGYGFNSWVKSGYFKSEIAYKTIFNDPQHIIAMNIQALPIQKLLAICKFEQIETILNESSFVIRYKASIPTLEIQFLINNKSHTLIVLSQSGYFCESVTLLDDVLSSLVAECDSYLSKDIDKSTIALYERLNEIPFIKKSLTEFNKNVTYDEIVKLLVKNSAGHMSKSNLETIAKAIHKSLDYSDNGISQVITWLCLSANLFLGTFLALGYFLQRYGFIGDILECGFAVSLSTWILASSINFILYKIRSNVLPRVISDKLTGVFKRIYSDCFIYGMGFLIIGLCTSSYQYDFVIKNFGLTDRYAINKTEDRHIDSSQPVKQSKKFQKSKH